MLLIVNIVDKTNTPLSSSITINGTTTVGTTVTQAITNDTQPIISVTQTGYYSYNKTINVFTNNITITVKLVTVITDITNGDYNKPFPAFFTITDPCSYNVYIYNASSGPYSVITWYINNNQVSTTDSIVYNFGAYGNYQIKQRMTAYAVNTATPQFDYYLGTILFQNLTYTVAQCLAADITTNFTLVNIVPEFSVTLSLPNTLLNSMNYYNLYEPIVVTPTFLEINPNCATPPVLSYSLYDSTGALVSTYEVSTAFSPLTFTFTPNTIGDYTLQSSLIDCCNSYTITTIVPVSNFIWIYPTVNSGDQYTVSNKSNTIPVVVTVTNLDGTPVLGPVNLLELQSTTFVSPEPGTYKVEVDYTIDGIPTVNYYIITDYYRVEECLARFIEKLFCENPCGCSDNSQLELKINRMSALLYTYFSYLNSQYMFNAMYSILGDTDLNNFRNADLILCKLKRYCHDSDCGCGCS